MRKSEKETISESIQNTLLYFSNQYKTAKILLCSDFNDFEIGDIENNFNLLQIVTFNTRNHAKLDLVLTDIPSYANKAEKLPPLSTSDHNMIFVNQPNDKPKYTTVFKRSFRNKDRIIESLNLQNWSQVYKSDNVDTKAKIFDDIVTSTLEKFCPLKKSRTKEDEPPWLSEDIKKAIKRMNKHYKKRNFLSWKIWRNTVVKKIRHSKRNYIARFINSEKSNAKEWWTIVNSLNGQPKQMSTLKTNWVLLDGEWLERDEIARRINEHFVNIGEKFINDDSKIPASNSTVSETHLPLVDQNVVFQKLKKN